MPNLTRQNHIAFQKMMEAKWVREAAHASNEYAKQQCIEAAARCRKRIIELVTEPLREEDE